MLRKVSFDFDWAGIAFFVCLNSLTVYALGESQEKVKAQHETIQELARECNKVIEQRDNCEEQKND